MNTTEKLEAIVKKKDPSVPDLLNTVEDSAVQNEKIQLEGPVFTGDINKIENLNIASESPTVDKEVTPPNIDNSAVSNITNISNETSSRNSNISNETSSRNSNISNETSSRNPNISNETSSRNPKGPGFGDAFKQSASMIAPAMKGMFSDFLGADAVLSPIMGAFGTMKNMVTPFIEKATQSKKVESSYDGMEPEEVFTAMEPVKSIEKDSPLVSNVLTGLREEIIAGITEASPLKVKIVEQTMSGESLAGGENNFLALTDREKDEDKETKGEDKKSLGSMLKKMMPSGGGMLGKSGLTSMISTIAPIAITAMAAGAAVMLWKKVFDNFNALSDEKAAAEEGAKAAKDMGEKAALKGEAALEAIKESVPDAVDFEKRIELAESGKHKEAIEGLGKEEQEKLAKAIQAKVLVSHRENTKAFEKVQNEKVSWWELTKGAVGLEKSDEELKKEHGLDKAEAETRRLMETRSELLKLIEQQEKESKKASEKEIASESFQTEREIPNITETERNEQIEQQRIRDSKNISESKEDPNLKRVADSMEALGQAVASSNQKGNSTVQPTPTPEAVDDIHLQIMKAELM